MQDKLGGLVNATGIEFKFATWSKNLYFLSQYYKRLSKQQKETLCYNPKYVVNLIECKSCVSSFPYTGSAKTVFRECLNNYKSTYRNFRNPVFLVIKKQKV